MKPNEYTKVSKHASVTKVLSPYSGYDAIHPMHLEKAANRGTVVHSHLAAHALGEWSPAPKPEYAGYVLSGKKWLDAFVSEVLLVETELEEPSLGFCGHPDLVIRSHKLCGVILIDWKTPATVHRKIWGAQLAAYAHMIEQQKGIEIDRIGSLRLNPDGKMAKFDEFTGSRAAFWQAFYAALIAYNFFQPKS
uniref:Putative PD-(D/E)XK nuclease superfamily protein n=1 Tax=viral metagenome TaxID=1070528 RepID=A0A6M3KK13_9ZZZZ